MGFSHTVQPWSPEIVSYYDSDLQDDIKYRNRQAWRCLPVNPEAQEVQKLKASLDNLGRPCLKVKMTEDAGGVAQK